MNVCGFDYFIRMHLPPIQKRPAQRGAQARPALFQFVLIHSLDTFELGLGEAEQFVQVDFRRGFAEQVAVEHQFCGVLLLVDARLQFAVNGAVADDRTRR